MGLAEKDLGVLADSHAAVIAVTAASASDLMFQQHGRFP